MTTGEKKLFWEVDCGIDCTTWPDEDIADIVTGLLEERVARFTVTRREMTQREFDRLQKDDEDSDEYDKRMAALSAQEVTENQRDRIAAEIATWPTLWPIDAAPALVAASGVMSVAEAQRLGIGEHAPDCDCAVCIAEPQCPAPPNFGKCDLCKRETDDLKQCSKCGAWCCYLDWWPEDASERVGAPGYPGAVLCDHCDWKKTYGESL